jgi:hypothetical protein
MGNVMSKIGQVEKSFKRVSELLNCTALELLFFTSRKMSERF